MAHFRLKWARFLPPQCVQLTCAAKRHSAKFCDQTSFGGAKFLALSRFAP
jgi:hypothetical protein